MTPTTIKTLTICQPYAELICLPESDERMKRVENRCWPTRYRGPLLIHAGKSRDWLDDGDEETFPNMAFGAIVGICRLVTCVSRDYIMDVMPVASPLAWLKTHRHTEGPYCFVLADVRRFASPIPYRGAQGFFDVPAEVVAEQMQAVAA